MKSYAFKYCPYCGIKKPRTEFYENGRRLRSYCKVCTLIYNREYRARLRQTKEFANKKREYRLKSLYAITNEDYESMVERQEGSCLICGLAPQRLVVDHDHTTNQIRGLLCMVCNTRLGWYETNRENVDSYLERN